MSNIPRGGGKGKKNQPTPDLSSNAPHMGQPTGQMPQMNGGMQNPGFATPVVQQNTAAAPPDYVAMQGVGGPTMQLGPSAAVIRNGSHGHYTVQQNPNMPYMVSMPPNQQQPYFQQNPMFQPQQWSGPAQYHAQMMRAPPPPYMQQHQQSQGEFDQHQASQMMNQFQHAQSFVPQQQMEQRPPIPAPAPPPQRQKKVLLIVNPNTNEVLNKDQVEAQPEKKENGETATAPVSQLSAAAPVSVDAQPAPAPAPAAAPSPPIVAAQAQPAPAAEADADLERKMNVRKMFADQIRLKAAEAAEEDSHHNAVKNGTSREPALPAAAEAEVKPAPADPVKDDSPVKAVEPVKESTPVSDPGTTNAVNAPVIEETKKEEEAPKEVKSEEQKENATTVVEEAATVIAPTTSVSQDTVHEEDESAPAEPEKTPEEKAAEEAERKRVREDELETKRTEYLANNDEVQLDGMVYGRKFLYVVRDIEMEFKKTDCLLTEQQLKDLGIDRASMPAQGERKQPNFNPSWLNRNNMNQGGRRPYTGRVSSDNHHRARGGGANRKLPPSIRPSIERTIERKVELHKAESAWKADRQIDKKSLDEQEAKKLELLRKIRSLMNKITPTTSAALTKEFIAFEVSADEQQLSDVIDIIFDKAVEEPKFCPMYSQLCRSQVNEELQASKGNQSLFRNAILARAQKTFMNRTAEDERAERLAKIEGETDEKRQKELKLELMEFDVKFRRRKFGNITFIGQLFSQGLLSTRVILFCLKDLLSPANEQIKDKPAANKVDDYAEECVACSVQLLESVGKTLDAIKVQTQGAQAQQQQDQGSVTDQFIPPLEKLMPHVSARIKFMILNLLELRRNKWVPRKTVEQGPKRIDQIHNDAKREAIDNQMQREKYERSQGLPPSRNSNGPPKKIMPPSRNSLDRMGANSKTNRLQKAAASATLTGSSVPAKSMNLKSLDSNKLGKKPNWSGGASGGGGDNGSSAPVPVKNAWGAGARGSREASESRKNSDAHAAALSRSASQQSVDGGPSEEDAAAAAAVAEEAKKIEIEKAEKLILRRVKGDLEEVASGDLTLEEVVTDLLSVNKKPTCKALTIKNVFRVTMQSGVEQMKAANLPALGHLLCRCLNSAEHKADALAGIAEYCKFAVETGAWDDFPNVWKSVAEVLINAVLLAPELFDGPRPTIDDFADAIVAAAEDDRKDYELLVLLLNKMVDLMKQREPEEYKSIVSFQYQDLQLVNRLDKKRLEQALEKAELSLLFH